MWITYFFKEFIVIWQANIFLPFKTATGLILFTFLTIICSVYKNIEDIEIIERYREIGGRKSQEASGKYAKRNGEKTDD